MKTKNLKKFFFTLACICFTNIAFSQVKIGSNPTVIEPASNLEVEASTGQRKVKVDKATGQVTIKDGTEGVGKVLTSNAVGGASWQKGVDCASTQVSRNGSQTVPINTSNNDPFITLVSNNEIYDPSNVYNPATGIYTVPASGYYIFSGSSVDRIVGVTNRRRNSTLIIFSSLQGIISSSVQQNILYDDGAYQNITSMAYLTQGEQISFQISVVHRNYPSEPLPTDSGGNTLSTISVSNITFNGTRIDCNSN